MTSLVQPRGLELPAAPVTLAIDPAHSSAAFAVKHLMIANVRGRFHVKGGAIRVDPVAFERSSVEAEIDVASVDTSSADRDAHLRSADFFDAERHPVMTFRSRRIEPTGEAAGRIVGDLTIRGVTREVALDATFEGVAKDPFSGARRAAFSAETAIDRKDFGLTWNQALETGGVLVGDRVRIRLDVSAVEA